MALKTPVTRELTKLIGSTFSHLSISLPSALIQTMTGISSLSGSKLEEQLYKVVGDVLLHYINDLGPVYGKLCQIFLSRASETNQKFLARMEFDRIYSDWPAVPFSEVSLILDREIPGWRNEFTIDKVPLGVASMGQVHAATDRDHKEWIIKILKPNSIIRMKETVQALRSLFSILSKLAITRSLRKAFEEADLVCQRLETETSLENERENILRAHERFKESRTKIIRVPQLHDKYCSKQVLVMERFHGTSIQKILSGEVLLTESDRKELAKDVLKELLIQVFEWGFFHGDPHSGNLMILKEGGIGLFDWGLTGELSETDRHHIAGILRSVMTLDQEGLIEVLSSMAKSSSKKPPSKEKIKKEIQKLIATVNRAKEKKSAPPSLQELLEMTLTAADRLKIDVPNGLLMMAKTILTIEGLARGLDTNISMAKVAGPVLFRAAKPGIGDIFRIAANGPTILKKLFFDR